MPIDVCSDSLLTLSEAARTLPGRVSVSTVWRWALRGVRGHRLATVLLGGRRYTSAEALQLFADQLTAAAAGVPAPVRTSRQREAAMARAERELANA